MISNLEDEKVRKRARSQILNWMDVLSVYGFNIHHMTLTPSKSIYHKSWMKHNKKHGNVSKCEKLWIHSIEEELGRNIVQNKKDCTMQCG
jgi:hypothetical protein